MFTGLIEEMGTVQRVSRMESGARLTILAKHVLTATQVGDSIAVNGVCLTVTSLQAAAFTADAVIETLERSTLGQINAGKRVNLERAMLANGRFGGHIVAGHVDATGQVQSAKREGDGYILAVQVPADLSRYIVEKGSIAIDGVSLTVMDMEGERVRVSLIPHSSGATTLGHVQVGDAVNLEVDMLAKYVEKLLVSRDPGAVGKAGLSFETLRNWGY